VVNKDSEEVVEAEVAFRIIKEEDLEAKEVVAEVVEWEADI